MIVDVASGATRKLVDNPGPDDAPRWSPDGSQIAFLTKPPKNAGVTQPRLSIVDTHGGTPRLVAPNFVYGPGPAVWAPDGQSLYFWTEVRTRAELFRVPVAGGEPKQVSDLKGSLGIFGGGTPSISRDGRRVGFG